MPRHYRQTTLITAGCLAVVIGIALAKFCPFDISSWWLLCLLLLWSVKSKSYLSLMIVAALGLGLGLVRGGIYNQKLDSLQQYADQKVKIQLKATSDAVYGYNSQLEFAANRVQLLEPAQTELTGRWQISGFGLPMVYRGDTIIASGKLRLANGSYQARLSYAQLQKVTSGQNWIDKLNRRIAAGTQTALPEPEASFGQGLLTGQRSGLPDATVEQLKAVGLIHIVAVSGYNLTILVRFIGRLKLGSKYQQLIASLILISVFILITGFSASIVRAAVVSVLGLWTWYYGRQVQAVTLIAFAAALTGLINPFYVWGDLGWYLSFLAFFGVLVIAPLITNRFFKRPPNNLALTVLETISAELMTLPLIMMNFSQLSLVALLANTLAVPLVPYAMLLTAVAAGAGAWLSSITGWFAWPAKWLLTYILDTAQILASTPMALLHRSLSVLGMLSIYFVIGLTMLVIYRQNIKNVKITDEK